jgi:serine/threonine protein phosphatase 1
MIRGRLSCAANRVVAIGDTHGHAEALTGLLRLVDPCSTDTIVFLGDYVSRGPDSRGVLQAVMDLRRHCQVVALLGNHEEMLLDARRDPESLALYVAVGGDAGLVTPLAGQVDRSLTREHWAFLEDLRLSHETDTHFFVHANYAPNRHLSNQDRQTALWLPLDLPPGPHFSGKTVVVGHTPQIDGRVLNLGHLVCIDTGCGFGGLLTAYDVESGQVWQVQEDGSSSPARHPNG